MEYREICYQSASAGKDIHAYVWEPSPDVKTVGVLQISHNIGEHAGRYAEFANFMTENGIVVCANDHLGHGKSANGQLGHFGGHKGYRVLAKDVFKLFNIMKKDYKDVPYIIMGHSLGSLIARYVCSLWGLEFDGAIFMGTSGGLRGSRSAIKAFTTIGNMRGLDTPAKRIYKIINKRLSKPFRVKGVKPTNLEWLSRDMAQIQTFANDPLCNFALTYAGYRDAAKLLGIVSGRQWAGRMPKDLPVYLLSGLEDSLGNFGRGVINTYETLVSAGCENVEIKLYEDARNDILFELNKDEVYEDIYKWIKETVLQ